MVNKNRDYGLDWERELVNFFKTFDPNCQRTPNSGAYGTMTGISSLMGDVRFDLDGLHFIIEAKAGYGGSKSITFQREWMDKVIEECKNNRPKRLPLVALKMRGSRKDSGKLMVLTLNTFKKLLEKFGELIDDLNKANEFIYSLKDKGVDVSDYIKM